MSEKYEVTIRLRGEKKNYPFGGKCIGTGYHFFAEKNYSATVSGSCCFVTDEECNRVALRASPFPTRVTKYDFMISHPADWNGVAYFNVVAISVKI